MAKENTKENKGKKGDYTADDIYILEGLEPVRQKRPGMYIGSTGVDGLHHLVWEIFDNSRDEAMGGHSNEIEVAILPGEKVRVADNGRGYSGGYPQTDRRFRFGNRYDDASRRRKIRGESYKISGGLHGVGASVVNALSAWLKVEVHQNGGKHVQEYKIGEPQAKVKKSRTERIRGTVVTFEPDPKIFSEIKFNYQTILNHLRQQAYLVKKLRIRVMDLREL